MENIRKMHELLKDRPELQKKITGEASLLVENNEAGEKEALARAVKASLDIDLTEEELDTLFAKAAELDPEELRKVGGGNVEGLIDYSWKGALIGGSVGAGAGICGAGFGAPVGGFFGIIIGAVAGGVYGFLQD